MVRYESLMLVRTSITREELSILEKGIEKIVTAAKGEVITFDKWGKYRLAYPVQKNDYGIYILTRYDLPAEAVRKVNKELDTFFKIKCNDVVMRHVIVALPHNTSTSYKRPEPIDNQASASVDTFIREHSMAGPQMANGAVHGRSTADRDDNFGDVDVEA